MRAALLLSGALMAIAGAAMSQQPKPAAPPRLNPYAAGEKAYADNCSGCHGTDQAGGRGPALFNPALLKGRTDEALHATITNGVTGGEMPSFKGILTDDQIYQVIAYLRAHSDEVSPKPAFVPDPTDKVIRTPKQAVRLHVVARGLEVPWALAFLPDGRMLVTERAGRLRIIDAKGNLLPDPVAGTPKVWERQDSGLLDVAVHPDYRKNGWIYLSYADVAPGHVVTEEEANPPPGKFPAPAPPTMTVWIRGRIKDNRWVDTQEIYRAPNAIYSASGAHYGSRFLFDGKGHVFIAMGERGNKDNAQKLDTPLGKILRFNDDGTIPKDNPFVNTPGAMPAIWAYGNRNPEGLAWDPGTGLLWESENGPIGGDEINIIEKGKNYGWGVISMGIERGITERARPGMEQPIVYYTPSQAPSGIAFYHGTRYPGWDNSLFVAFLVGQQLRRLEIKGRQVVAQETIFEQFGRTRDVRVGPDGLLYALIQQPTGGATGLQLSARTSGMLIRLDPVK